MTSTPNQNHPNHPPPKQSPPKQPAPSHPGGRGPGIFVPQHVIVTAVCITLGALAGVLVWLTPTVWLPVGAGIAVTGLSLTLYGLWHGRHRS